MRASPCMSSSLPARQPPGPSYGSRGRSQAIFATVPMSATCMAVMGLHPLYSVDFGQLEMRHQAGACSGDRKQPEIFCVTMAIQMQRPLSQCPTFTGRHARPARVCLSCCRTVRIGTRSSRRSSGSGAGSVTPPPGPGNRPGVAAPESATGTNGQRTAAYLLARRLAALHPPRRRQGPRQGCRSTCTGWDQ